MTFSQNDTKAAVKDGTSRLSRVRRVYFLITGLYWFATALPMPLLVLIQRRRGMDLFEIGVLTAIFSITIVILEVPTGGLADAWGRRRVSMAAYFVMAASLLLLAVSGSFALFAMTFVLYGVGRALISGALEAWFVDQVLALGPEEELQRSLAHGNTVALFSLSTASLAGGFLPKLASGISLPGGLTGLALPPAAAAVILLVTAFLTGRLVTEYRPGTSTTSAAEAGAADHQAEAAATDAGAGTGSIVVQSLRETVTNPTLLLLASLSLIAGAAISTMETFWQPFFSESLGAGTPTVLFGVITAGNFLLAMAGNMLSTPLTRLLGGKPARFAACVQVLRGVFLLFLGLQSSLLPAVSLFWLAYLAAGATESPHQTLINRNVAPERRSAMLSVQSLSTSLGAFGGGALFGYLAEVSGISTVWIVTSVYLVVSFVLYLRVDARESRSERVQHIAAEADLGTASS